jgi:hypothetical protein
MWRCACACACAPPQAPAPGPMCTALRAPGLLLAAGTAGTQVSHSRWRRRRSWPQDSAPHAPRAAPCVPAQSAHGADVRCRACPAAGASCCCPQCRPGGRSSQPSQRPRHAARARCRCVHVRARACTHGSPAVSCAMPSCTTTPPGHLRPPPPLAHTPLLPPPPALPPTHTGVQHRRAVCGPVGARQPG